MRPSLRIALLCLHSSPLGSLGARDTGGMSVVVRETARHLAQMGHRVDVFTSPPGSRGAGMRVLAPGVRLVEIEPGVSARAGKLALRARVPEVAAAVETFRRRNGLAYDLAHSHYWLSALAGERLAARWGVPHAITFHTLAAVKNRLGCGEDEPRVRQDEEARLGRTADRVIVPSLREAGELERCCPGAPVQVVPCGVDLERFRPVASAPRPHGRPLVLYVGRITPVKGLDLLLASLARLGPDIRLWVVGGEGSADAARVEAWARQAGVEGQVRYLGPRGHDRLPALYSAADAVVVPSRYESFGLVILEALATGTPVASTRVGVAEEAIRPGENGCLAHAADPDALAEAVRSALALPRLPGRIRGSVARFSWDRVTGDLAAVYHELVRPAPVAAFS
ncbi:MAG: glycosyltransferase family 1 protein [Deltaproteobacteria bacterium]|nr:glycosyltransferase family 1 protein [Deltaproteobacteria bacterium]